MSNDRLMSAVLESLERLCTSSHVPHPACSRQWVEMLQSGLARILDVYKSSDEERKPDQATALKVIGLFITKAPADVVKPPNLQYPMINLLKQFLQSEEDVVIQVKCLQTLQLIFRHDNKRVTFPYIHALAPRIVELLIKETNNTNVAITNEKYHVVMNALIAFETLVDVADTNKKMDILGLYIPILINLLIEDTQALKDKSPKSLLHTYALQKLIDIGPKYPQEFRQIINQVPSFRTKLESAIRSQSVAGSNGSTAGNQTQSSTRNDNPTIKLKTDFSNFTKSS